MASLGMSFRLLLENQGPLEVEFSAGLDPADCSPPGSSVHGILEARILEWAAIPFSRGSSRPRHRTRSPALQADSFYHLSHQGSPS